VFIKKPLLFLRHSFRAMGDIHTKIYLQFLEKGRNSVFLLQSEATECYTGVYE
jgi:hypothetical protein